MGGNKVWNVEPHDGIDVLIKEAPENHLARPMLGGPSKKMPRVNQDMGPLWAGNLLVLDLGPLVCRQ